MVHKEQGTLGKDALTERTGKLISGSVMTGWLEKDDCDIFVSLSRLTAVQWKLGSDSQT